MPLFTQKFNPSAPFKQAVDVTASRALGTQYTNGQRHRWVFVTVDAAASATDNGMMQRPPWQVGLGNGLSGLGGTFTMTGEPSPGVTGVRRYQFSLPVDPGGTYQCNAFKGATGTCNLINWLEVDA